MTPEERAALEARINECKIEIAAAQCQRDVLQKLADDLQTQRAELAVSIKRLKEEIVTIEKRLAEPEPEPDPEPDPEPGPGEKIRVADGTALTKVLAAGGLKPDTVLALHPDGKFPGTYTCTNSGADKDHPIFIVAEQASAGRRTKITGKFIARGAFIKLSGFDFSGDGTKIEILGRGVRVNRCTFTGVKASGIIKLTGGNHPDVEIDRNEFRSFAGAAVQAQLRDVTKTKNIKIHRNLFNKHSPLGDNEAVIQILTDAFNVGNIQYHKNLFLDCLQNNNTGQNEIISVKTGGAAITENTIIGTSGAITLRETSKCRVVKNWLDAQALIKVHGDDHTLVENFGEGCILELNRGDAYTTDPTPDRCRGYGKNGLTTIVVKRNGDCGTAHTSTRRAVVEHNVGLIRIGSKNDERYGYSKPCQGLKLRYNKTKAERFGSYPDTLELEIGVTTNAAKRLTPADVGILAS